tara:strand:- start:83 stop:271 length:189 start_codon:yes stop_codon:yes gene_type:complete
MRRRHIRRATPFRRCHASRCSQVINTRSLFVSAKRELRAIKKIVVMALGIEHFYERKFLLLT